MYLGGGDLDRGLSFSQCRCYELLDAVPHQPEIDALAGAQQSDRISEFVSAFHGLVADQNNNVAGLDPRCFRRRACHDL